MLAVFLRNHIDSQTPRQMSDVENIVVAAKRKQNPSNETGCSPCWKPVDSHITNWYLQRKKWSLGETSKEKSAYVKENSGPNCGQMIRDRIGL